MTKFKCKKCGKEIEHEHEFEEKEGKGKKRDNELDMPNCCGKKMYIAS